MTTNFDFLKNIDNDLFIIAGIAEKLYRDEYFEQCMGQTRRFAENAIKRLLGKNAPYDATFDQLINTLKDRSTGNSIEKEFIDDLYFLKKAGNISVHGAVVKKDGITALECLRRMFEVAINYAVHIDKTNANLLKLSYDEELLLLGRPKQQKTLQEKYIAAKELFEEKEQSKPLIQKTKKKPAKTGKIKTEKFVPEKPARIKKSTKPARQELKINKKKITAGKKKRQSKKSKGEHILPLFLNPVVIGISFVMGLVVLFAFAVYFKIL